MSGYNYQNILYFLCEDLFFTLTNSVDPDEMQHYAAFHLGSTVCKSTHLGGSLKQRVKKKIGL